MGHIILPGIKVIKLKPTEYLAVILSHIGMYTTDYFIQRYESNKSLPLNGIYGYDLICILPDGNNEKYRLTEIKANACMDKIFEIHPDIKQRFDMGMVNGQTKKQVFESLLFLNRIWENISPIKREVIIALP